MEILVFLKRSGLFYPSAVIIIYTLYYLTLGQKINTRNGCLFYPLNISQQRAIINGPPMKNARRKIPPMYLIVSFILFNIYVTSEF